MATMMTSTMIFNASSARMPPQDALPAGQAPVVHGRKTAVLKQRYITPADVDVPIIAKTNQLAHYAIPINQITAQLAAQANRIVHGADGQRKTEIDGFYLLEVGGLSFPEDLQQVNLADRKLQTVIDEDLAYFSELLYVDVSENFLPLHPFGALPVLRELRMACNHIKHVGELYGFENLLYLDLSYNSLTPEAVLELSAMPRLKEVDLSGNQLRALPADLSGFAVLEKLVLEYNKFDDNAVFVSIATIPNLRALDVSHNFLSHLPKAAVEYHGYKFLEVLDLSFNYFSTEDDVNLLLQMPRLLRVLLYGNPLLGPTGEDPLFTYIEDLVEQSVAVREEAKSIIPDVEFVTEIPRRRLLKKGQPLGRFALYRDFSIVQVDDPLRELTARQWKARGAGSVFGEAVVKAKQTANANMSSSASAPTLPDFTFITNSIAGGNIAAASTREHVRGPGGMDIDEIADGVMQKVALEMGLINADELRVFEKYTRLPLTVLEKEALQAEAEADAAETERIRLDEQHSRGGSAAMDDWDGPLGRGEEDERSLGGSTIASEPECGELEDSVPVPIDRVPQALFATNMNNPAPTAQLSAQPVALRTAMKALQHALAQPLTNYNEVPASWSLAGRGRDHARHTAATRLRQLPRIPLPVEEEEEKWDKRSLRFQRRGLAEPPALARMRQETRDRTLTQIDLVLHQLNARTASLTDTSPAQGADPAAVGHLRQNMENMRTFAKPKSGVKKLMNMVHNIVEEFST